MQNNPSTIYEEPIRTESDSSLKDFAFQLNEKYSTNSTAFPAKSLLEHLSIWEKVLQEANSIFKNIPSKELPVSRAGEWMLDNFYVVKQTIRQIEEDLPIKFLKQLPKVGGIFLPGQPLIFALACDWIDYSQSQIDLNQTSVFLQEYQKLSPLMIGEIWAFPIMLRIGVLERLVIASSELTGMRIPEGVSSRQNRIKISSMTNDNIVANCFLSLRLLSATDWKDFFEQTSRVEQVLRDDPAGIYSQMDFGTRNSYRSVIEELARHSNLTEEQVALTSIEMARDNEGEYSGRKFHVGFFLRDEGLAELEKRVQYQPPLGHQIQRKLLEFPTVTYFLSIAVLTIILALGLVVYSTIAGGSVAQIIVTGLLGTGLALDAAISIVHWNVTHRIKPRSLPRMDFSEGIPQGYRTMVVVPTLLEGVDELQHLLQELELYYLANPDPQLTYALLTDYSDAPSQVMTDDALLLSMATKGINNLNHKYAKTSPFYLFHRQREWNPSEGVWMGWERKRGKLAEFNKLLLDMGETSYMTQVGDASILGEIKYVITLDADTSLPQGSAYRLVATLAHPLNCAVFSPDGRSVVAGYTVLQPRVSIKPTSANRSIFSRIFAGNSGFDLYSFAVSDVYQDLFGEGSYVGKGIYDVVAFERSLAGQVRENTLLSHDLFEGIYGRAALVTDIVLYEDYPSRYLVYARRLRRWIRGDWQLLPWLFPIVHTPSGKSPNRLSAINLWKIFDNLRRSLLPPTMLAFIAAGWVFLPGSPIIWTLLVILPSIMPMLIQGFQFGRYNLKRLPLNQILNPLKLPIMRWALVILFLPYEALLILGAIGTTLIRMFIQQKNLLQWTTAANTARLFRKKTSLENWVDMSASLILTLTIIVVIIIFNLSAIWIALPFLLSWLIAPQIVNSISQPTIYKSTPITEDQKNQVRRLARRTWAFFEQFAGPNDHWLPPDHYQESPGGKVAHYTTPTNIGLFLVSTLSAYDMGYMGLFELAVRLQSTFDSISRLEHYRGHLLNWYDSLTLESLQPRYISTVDSGNLAASLIALKQGCLSLSKYPVLDSKRWSGLLVLLDIISETLQSVEKNNPSVAIQSFAIELSEIYGKVNRAQSNSTEWTKTLRWLSNEGWANVSRKLLDLLGTHPNLNQEALADLQLYLDLLHHSLEDMQRSLSLFAPWLSRLDTPLEIFTGSSAWKEFLTNIPDQIPTLGQASNVYRVIRQALNVFKLQMNDVVVDQWCDELDDELLTARMTVAPLLIGFDNIALQAESALATMDFGFLFNQRRQVFHIGYNVSTERLDPSFYDLLASEARMSSLIAIAKGEVPQSHWQHLGRPVTIVNGKQVLLSWSGTMFEYLMPTLFTKNYIGTFLSDSCYVALESQISYGNKNKVPWGISESGYFAFDLNMNYQYRAFGVPELGYKRDLPEDLVVAPYASIIGISLKPKAVLENISRFEQMKLLGRFGYYEAIDYTKARMPAGKSHEAVLSYMAHHQGMSFVAISNYLLGDIMIERFHSDERIRSVELLLQEKIPLNPPIEYPHTEEVIESTPFERMVSSGPWRVSVDSPIPQANIIATGDTSVMITNSGSGYSQWRDFALTRWQSDTTLDHWGSWIYIQDRDNGDLWSATCQPIGCVPEQQEVLFFPHKAEFRRWDNGISLHTVVTVSINGVEIRQVSILNDSEKTRHLRLSSYGEVVLSSQSNDRRHPAFNKLFIVSEFLPKENALIFSRRLRSTDEKPIFLGHSLIVESGRKVTGEFECDRNKFLGRSQTGRKPISISRRSNHLSGTSGGTLDPIYSIAQEIDLKPHTRARLTFLTYAASSRKNILETFSRYHSQIEVTRAIDEACSYNDRDLLEIGLNSHSIESIQQIYSALIYSVGILRSAPHILAQNEKGQSGLWAFGISGDFPILLVRIFNGETQLLQEALQAYFYWRKRHIIVNLVVLNSQDTGYAQDLHDAIHRQIGRMGVADMVNQREGIFVLRSDQLQLTDKTMFESVAGVILDENNGSLENHARHLNDQTTHLPPFTPSNPQANDGVATPPLPIPENLIWDNGLGGFSSDGKEYVIHLQPGQHTPKPWVNVIANDQFGFLVSESGSGSTWAINSGENRLTPWRNDPVSDLPGEAIYLRDEETGQVWSPTPMPSGGETSYLIRHGAGYSTFESQSHGLRQYLRLFASPSAPLKIAHLRLENLWDRPRRITVTYYAEWVMGTTRETNQAFIVPEFDSTKNALLATNHYNSDFRDRVAFLASSRKPHGLTTDRTEFLGRMGDFSNPAALSRIGLASAVDAGLDPCAAIQLHVDLSPGTIEEVYFLLGEGATKDETLDLIKQNQNDVNIEMIWESVHQQWDEILGTLTVDTPDSAMNMMLNRWLLYQTLSCRIWGRTGLYQSSGAFGFRDQLQDVLAMIHARPGIARAHILMAASHQFEAGDVLHWWNPPIDRGVRTRFSDDLLWLPYVTAEYINSTGDKSILSEKIKFLKGEPLQPGEIERYTFYESTDNTITLYQHCKRALDKSAAIGDHGLPLIGSGDWNDGMNRVGMEGRGESVWLGWFRYNTIKRFAPFMAFMKDDPTNYLQQVEQVARSIEANAWDGYWYKRAFYDDGSSLGSYLNDECQIDSIAQSWAVLSEAGDPIRSEQAMESVYRLLVKKENQLVALFTPPFDKTSQDPGYVKGYLPGVRENGGQYTHAAVWAAWAFAKLGQGDQSFELFSMLNPINHTDTQDKMTLYKTEPYVIAADVYSIPPHAGHGGWTWYTGSSAWMYRLGIEAILGITREGENLRINPCIPQYWPGFTVNYHFGTAMYEIKVSNPGSINRGIKQIQIDGSILSGNLIRLNDDGLTHHVVAVLE